MEEMEDPTEHIQEEMHEHAREAGGGWIMGVALSSAFLAALAAVTALMSGHYINEAMIEQIQASDQWSYYQAKGIKAAIVTARVEMLTALEKTPDPKAQDDIARYGNEQKEIKKVAEEKEHLSGFYLHRHVVLSRGVTLFQVAIAVAAISILIRKKGFWYLSMLFGVVGLFFLARGLTLKAEGEHVAAAEKTETKSTALHRPPPFEISK